MELFYSIKIESILTNKNKARRPSWGVRKSGSLRRYPRSFWENEENYKPLKEELEHGSMVLRDSKRDKEERIKSLEEIW